MNGFAGWAATGIGGGNTFVISEAAEGLQQTLDVTPVDMFSNWCFSEHQRAGLGLLIVFLWRFFVVTIAMIMNKNILFLCSL